MGQLNQSLEDTLNGSETKSNSNEKQKHTISALAHKHKFPTDSLHSSLARNEHSAKQMKESKSHDRDSMMSRLKAAGVLRKDNHPARAGSPLNMINRRQGMLKKQRVFNIMLASSSEGLDDHSNSRMSHDGPN